MECQLLTGAMEEKGRKEGSKGVIYNFKQVGHGETTFEQRPEGRWGQEFFSFVFNDTYPVPRGVPGMQRAQKTSVLGG